MIAGRTAHHRAAREAADTYTRKLGFEGLQVVWSLQNDGKAGLYHLHAVFNLVRKAASKIHYGSQTETGT